MDAVTGATFSSRGIASPRRSRPDGGRARDGPLDGGEARVQLGAPEIVLVLLFLAGAVGRNRPGLRPRTRKLLRAGTLLASLATIGFLWNRPWVIAFPTRLLAGDWPSWTTHLYWYILLAGLLLVFNRTGGTPTAPGSARSARRRIVIGLVGGARKRRLPSALLFTWVKRVLLWLAVAPGPAVPRSRGDELRGVRRFLPPFRHRLPVRDPRPRPRDGGLRESARSAAGCAPWTRPSASPAPPEHGPCGSSGARRGCLRPRRPVLLRAAPEVLPAVPVFRRLRNRLLTAAGLLCALLVLGHFHERLSAQGRGNQEGLLGRTFVSTDSRNR